MNITALSNQQFNFFKKLIYAEAGIKLSDEKKSLMQSRILKRIRALKLNDFPDYYDYFINNFDKEKINFINCITTNKTDFFREKKHFEFICDSVLPQYEKEGKKEVRIWSAGCSTGEEPYSIAITIAEYFHEKKLPQIKILATDIDTQVLKFAQTGIYGKNRLNGVSIDILRHYFLRGRGEHDTFVKVKDKLRDMVYFNQLNLLEESYPMKKEFDMIFCRNVIIYFDKETQRKLFLKLHKKLDKDGYLFIGHSENILNLTKDFKSLKNTIYRKVITNASQI